MSTIIKTKQELVEQIHVHEKEIRAFGVKKLAIFGSFARNEATPESDVDIFVEMDFENKTLKKFMGLIFLLESITGRKVEVVTPQSLSKHIGPYILNELEYVAFAA